MLWILVTQFRWHLKFAQIWQFLLVLGMKTWLFVETKAVDGSSMSQLTMPKAQNFIFRLRENAVNFSDAISVTFAPGALQENTQFCIVPQELSLKHLFFWHGWDPCDGITKWQKHKSRLQSARVEKIALLLLTQLSKCHFQIGANLTVLAGSLAKMHLFRQKIPLDIGQCWFQTSTDVLFLDIEACCGILHLIFG